MSYKSSSSNSLLSSFTNAFNGIRILLKTERNAKIHFIAAIVVLAMGLFLKVSITEWSLLLLCIALVSSLEGINSSIEILADIVHPGRHEKIKRLKDIAAGSVLLSACASAIIGLFIFIPKLILLW